MNSLSHDEKSHELLQGVFDASLSSISVLRAVRNEHGELIDLEWVLANRVAVERAKQTSLAAKRISEVYPQTVGRWFERYLQILETGVPGEFEDQLIVHGKPEWFHVSAQKFGEDELIVTATEVTERRQAQEEMLGLQRELAERATDRFRRLFDTIDQGLIIGQVVRDELGQVADYRYLEMNPALERMGGLTKEHMVGRLASEVRPEEFRERLAKLDEVLRIGGTVQFEYWSRSTQRWYDAKLSPFGGDQVAILYEDITERKLREALVSESEGKFRALVEPFAQTTWETDADGMVVGDSPSWRAYTGQTLGEWLREGWANAVHPDDRDFALRQWREAVLKCTPVNAEFRIRGPNGEWCWTNMRATPLRDDQGKVLKWVGMNIDITERRLAQQQREESNQKLNRILESIQDDFYVLNRDWVFVFCSRSFTSKIGKQPEDFVGNNIWEMFPKHVGTEIEENFRAAMEKREVRRFEMPGRYTNAWYRMTAFPSEEGITVLGTDITDRKRAEEALHRSERRLQRVLETEAVGVIFFNSEGAIIQANDVFLHMTGYTREQIDQQELNWHTLTPPEFMAASNAQMARFARTGRVGPYEKQYIMADGSRRWMLFAGRDVGDGTIAEYCIDVTDRKRAEEALHALNDTLEQRVQAKTGEVRRLTSDLIKVTQRERQRISHVLHDDLQQRLHAIRVQLSFLRDALDRQSGTSETEVALIEKELDEMLKITRDLSIDLSPPILRQEGLTQAIQWLASRMRQQYRLPIEVEAKESFALADEDLHVLLFNCVHELLFNVAKHAEASRAVVKLQRLNSDLQIEVSDDGKGFSTHTLRERDHAESGRSLTLGLPTVRYQVSLFGGSMEIKTKPGEGTRVVLTVPLAEREANGVKGG